MRITTVLATIESESIAAYLKASVANGSAAVETEPGCYRFDVIQDAENPALIGFYEVYADDAAVDAHSETAHFHKWVDATDGMGDMGWGTCRNVFPEDDAGWAAAPGPVDARAGGLHINLAALRVASDQVTPFLDALTKLAAASVENESGCMRFDVAQSLDQPTELWVYEVFADRQAHASHRESPHRRTYDEAVANWYADESPTVIRGANIWPPDSWHWSPAVP